MVKIERTNISDEVAAWLKDGIRSGRLVNGEKLPAVEQIADELGVGRSSVREAWRHLQALGMIQVIHGKGTFITSPKMSLNTQTAGFSEAIRERGMKPGSIVLKREVLPADPEVAHALNLQPGNKVNMLHRLRLADEVPMAIQVSYTPHYLFPELLDIPWTLDTSLYTILAEKYNFRYAYANQTIRVSLIDEEQGQLLQVNPGSPALELDTIVLAADGTPFEFGHDIYRGDRYQYTITLQKKR